MLGSLVERAVTRSSASARLAFTAVIALSAVAALGSSVASAASNPPVNGAPPVISGTARQDQSLSTTTGSWGGATPISFAYRWQRCDSSGAGCQPIAYATSATYKLTSADVGHTLRTDVTATNGDGTAQALSSPTAAIANAGSAPANTKQPNPSGTPKDGDTVSVDNGNWSGSQPITFTYQWQLCNAKTGSCANIAGATSAHEKVVTADVGSIMRASVTATNSVGNTVAYSNVTAVVAAKDQAPSIVTLPIVAGSLAVGQTLVASSGTWKGASGVFSYQWSRCNSAGTGCTSIPGANSQSYTVTGGDAGSTLAVTVRASNDVGSTSSTSAAVKVPAPGTSVGGGLTSVAVTSLTAHPDHLLISSIVFSPSPFRTRNGVITARFRVTDQGTTNVVSGALVDVVGIPYNWVVGSAEQPTGTDGWVTIRIKTTSKMQLTRGGVLVMQVRARAPGSSAADILGGISTRRLVQLKLAPAA
jgi:hypothetical protein